MPDEGMHLSFDQAPLDPRLSWHCEPSQWSVDPERRVLRIQPADGTDFWQTTRYGFQADNGHFLFMEAPGDFVLTTHVRFQPVHQYDQAGLMVRISPACWLKTSVEFEPEGPNRLGAVVTNDAHSDWSTQEFPRMRSDVWLRVRREGTDYIVDAADDGRHWRQIRMANLREDRAGRSVACGLYACSPKAAGYTAEFGFLDLVPGRVA